MKKFFVALCGMFAFGTVFAAPPSNYYEPDNSAKSYMSDWKVSGNYNQSIDDSFYSNLNGRKLSSWVCTNDSSGCKITHDSDGIAGTTNDEGAVVLDIAREIYKNGAKFCTTQIQAANRNGRQYVWLDYHSNNNYDASCKTYCKQGYDPETNCDERLTEDSCDSIKTYPFLSHDVIRQGGSSGRFTTEMQVFSFANETGAGASNEPAGNKFTKHVVLGIIGKDSEDGVGIKVAPIEITGRRGGSPMQSWIYSVKHNNNITVLCPQGYALNSGVCVKTSTCEAAERLDNLCPSFSTGYKEDEHELKLVDGCWEYRCKQDGYGFKSSTDKTCTQCVVSKGTGVKSNGECETCDVGQCFNRQEKQCDNCRHNPSKLELLRGPNYQTQNKQCWRKTNLHEFWGCVLCTDDKPYWYNDSGCTQSEK